MSDKPWSICQEPGRPYQGPWCRKCGCGGDWHFYGCIRGQQRGDTIWVRDGRLWDELLESPK